MKKFISLLLVLTVFVFAFASCGNADQSAETTSADSSAEKSVHHVEITFEGFGTVTAELYGGSAPITVNNFISLAKSGYYDGTKIIRVKKGFVIQGGQGDGADSIKGEFSSNGVNTGLTHTRGTLSMARSNSNDSASDQFFICLDDSSAKSLDGNYAAFGKITVGMDVIDALVRSVNDYTVQLINGTYYITDFGDYYEDISYGIEYGFLKENKYITITSVKAVD